MYLRKIIYIFLNLFQREIKSKPSDVIKFIDEESPLEPQPPGIPAHSYSPSTNGGNPSSFAINRSGIPRVPTALSIAPLAMVRSCSAGFLDAGLMTARREAPKRLVLIDKEKRRSRKPADADVANPSFERKCVKLKCSGKSRSLDSSDIFSSSRSPQRSEHCAVTSKDEKSSENDKIDSGSGDYASIADMISGGPIDIPK